MKTITYYIGLYGMLFFALLFFVILFSGCSANKRLQKLEATHPELFKLHNSDSVRTKIVQTEKDSIIYQPGATNTYTVTVPCPPSVKYTHIIHSKGVTSTLIIDSGKATVECECDSVKEINRVLTDSIKTLEIKNTSGMATTQVVVNSFFAKVCMWFAGIVFVFGLLMIAWKVFKPKV